MKRAKSDRAGGAQGGPGKHARELGAIGWRNTKAHPNAIDTIDTIEWRDAEMRSMGRR